ncbi:MAG TPA: RNA polymerase sigma factor [Phnomibacter sp.]|nr:RNA polymerase sigma factor [Phnomibacter sp.]
MAALYYDRLLLDNLAFLKPFAIKLTRNNENANDLIQETMYKALANREKYLAGTNIKAWLFTIMRNIFINDYRRRAKQQTVFDSSPNEFLLNQHQVFTTNIAIGRLQMKEMQMAIDRLPGIFKIPLLLHFSGYKYHEIAEQLAEPLGTIKSRIHFARKLLKAQIDRH